MQLTWPTLLFAAELIARAVMVVIILLRPRRSSSDTLAWITIVVAVPLVGIVAYLLLGTRRLGRKRLDRHRQIVSRIESPANFRAGRFERLREARTLHPDDRQIAALAETVGAAIAREGNRTQLYGDTDEVISQMVADIDAATDHCHLLFYIYVDDHAGRKIADALIRATRRGVACRVLVDGVGSRQLLKSSLRQEMETAGVAVAAALPVNPFRMLLARIDLRNHRKIMVIDGSIGYVGSQNIAGADFSLKPKFAPWIDAIIRLQGPSVLDLQTLFVEDWYLDTDESLESVLRIDPPVFADDGVAIQIVGTGPDTEAESVRQLLQASIHIARSEIILTTPYFVPDDATLLALSTAAMRGVETTLVLPAHNDSAIVAAASRSNYARLLDAGVGIYELQHGLLHAKTMTIDRRLAIIGSANIDLRSFSLNFEANAIIYNTDFASRLRFLQHDYISNSDKIFADQWRKRRWPKRFVQNALGLMSPVL